jgi:epidermal growth factor receptor substrate 15
VFGQLFAAADTDNIGVVTGEVAVKFFEKTKLAPATLGEVWFSPSGLGSTGPC